MPGIKFALGQMNIVFENKEANYKIAKKMAEEAADNKADVLILPEMFATGFSFNIDITAESEDGPTVSFIKELAKEFNLNIIFGYVRRVEKQKGENSALAVNTNGQIIYRYVKNRVFSYAGEHRVHIAGNRSGFFDIKGVKTAIFICYDLRFPEVLRKAAAESHVTAIISLWPSSRQKHYDNLLIERAIENQCYVLGVNRTGKTRTLDYSGGTVAIDPLGNVICKTGSKEALLFAEVSTETVNSVRKEMPFLNDMR
jgi:predicted amidohydrolase